MKLQLDFHPEISNEKIQIGNKITLLGSCFSDEIAIRLTNSGFHVVTNPFGTIFHPTALANLLLTTDVESSVIKRDDLFFSWLAAGSIYSSSKENLVSKDKEKLRGVYLDGPEGDEYIKKYKRLGE